MARPGPGSPGGPGAGAAGWADQNRACPSAGRSRRSGSGAACPRRSWPGWSGGRWPGCRRSSTAPGPSTGSPCSTWWPELVAVGAYRQVFVFLAARGPTP